jgi:hypothetical protein
VNLDWAALVDAVQTAGGSIMSYKIEDDDYLDLWKYFQERADNVKEAMFNSVTWSVGFVAAILGFIMTTQVNVADLSVAAPKAVIGVSLIGLLLCVYSWIVVLESKKHIRRNWHYADACKLQVEGLDSILRTAGPGNQPRDSSGPLGHVWNQVLCVVGVFALFFVALIVWSIAGSGA